MTQRRLYRIVNPSNLTDLANQLNNLLGQLSDRFDQIEGFRGTPAFESDVDLQGNRIINVGAAVAATDVPTLSQAGGTGGDHGALTGLTDDDHPQYAKLAGRAGGQTLKGGTGASEILTLQSTSNATRGEVKMQGDDLKVYDSNGVLIHGFLTK